MNTCELFSGTKSFSKVMSEKGYSTLTIDFNKDLNPDLIQDLSKEETLVKNITLLQNIDIFWASPPCTAFSVASIGKHWTGGKRAYIPKTENAKLGLLLLENTIRLIAETKPKYWFIENPRGMMRIVINNLFDKYNIDTFNRETITYCQYGDSRMKPTDIWTNVVNWKGKRCNNGDSCHISAPRGSKTGTQGLANAKDRGVIPPALFVELLFVIEQNKLN